MLTLHPNILERDGKNRERSNLREGAQRAIWQNDEWQNDFFGSVGEPLKREFSRLWVG
jgi:hypothetical protein